jgi:hypothetical protein
VFTTPVFGFVNKPVKLILVWTIKKKIDNPTVQFAGTKKEKDTFLFIEKNWTGNFIFCFDTIEWLNIKDSVALKGIRQLF